MMTVDVSAYIRELLFGHDCVIVPGFGAFIANLTPSRIDRAEGIFYPPAKKIAFNRHLTTNDGLLIGHISARTGKGYSEARDIVNSFADDMRRRIADGSRINLDYIGSFTTNREGTIIFEPDSDANYLLTSFGLDSYHRQPVSDYDVRKKVLEHHHKPSMKQPSMRKLLTRAAVIIPLLVAMALIPFNTNLFKGRVEESSLNPLATAELEYNRAHIINVAPAAPTDSVVLEEPVQKPVVVHFEVKYMLVTGSFKSESNVLLMVETLRNKGYDPEVTAGPDGFLRVMAGAYGTMEEAETAMGKLKSSYPGTWICKSE